MLAHESSPEMSSLIVASSLLFDDGFNICGERTPTRN